MITLIHGPAELLRSERLAEIRAGIADDLALVDLNTTRLDGRQITVAELQDTCDTMPFLTGRRLVVVDGLLRRLTAPSRPRPVTPEQIASEEAMPEEMPAPEASKMPDKKLLAYLDRVPATTELVFLEDNVLGGGTALRRLLELQRDGRARIILCEKPKKNDLPAWIRERAKFRTVRLDAAAVADLAEFVGDDLRQLDQELIKLANYSAGGGDITRADVRRLVPATRAANVFELVEALASGDALTAGRLMYHALDADGEQPLRLLGMISRQYRLLIQVKALQAEGVKAADIARMLNVPDWTVPKLVTQAGRHNFARLQWAMERILAADEAIKTGTMADREAMDVLLAELVL